MLVRATIGFIRRRPVLHVFITACLLLTISAILFFTSFPLLRDTNHANSDFFTFWLGGRLLSEGVNPYDADAWLNAHHTYNSSWFANPLYIYPLPLAILFIPLSMLPLEPAFAWWSFLSIFCVILTVYIISRSSTRGRALIFFFPLFAGAFLFRPVLVTLMNGQIGALLLLLLTAGVHLFSRKRWFFGGILLAPLLFKPQLGVPLLGLLGLWLLLERRWFAILGMAVSTILAFFGSLLLFNNWPATFISAISNKLIHAFGFSPTIWGLVGYLSRQDMMITTWLGFILNIALILLVFVIFLRNQSGSPYLAAAVFVPLALLVTPYTWAYDQILLILPVGYCAIYMWNRGNVYLFSAVLPIALAILSLILLWIASVIDHDAWSSMLPFICLWISLTALSIRPSDAVDCEQPHKFLI